MKTDQRIYDIVVAAVRRHSMDMDAWVRTWLWGSGEAIAEKEVLSSCDMEPLELPILCSYIDPANWTLVTTRRIWYSVEARVGVVDASEVTEHCAGDFKGIRKQELERMVITSRDGGAHYCLFETGKPSMGIIYAIRTLCQLRSAA